MLDVRIHRMQLRKYFRLLLALILFAGSYFFSIAISLEPSLLTIPNVGRISSQCDVYAVSGSASDIQAAVNLVVNSGGIGNVLLPEGTFNFYEVGETWTTVLVPAGVNIIGASTERDSDGQVLEWKTILVMPFEAPDDSTWFEVNGNNDPNEQTRITDLKLVGYVFMLIAAWFICGIASQPFLKAFEGEAPTTPLHVIIFLVLGWLFLFLSHYKSHQQ